MSETMEVAKFRLGKRAGACKDATIFFAMLFIVFIPFMIPLALISIIYNLLAKYGGFSTKSKVTTPEELADSELKNDEEREYDLIVVGGTGFTGSKAIRYLANTYGLNGELKWAVCARNESKLVSVLRTVEAECELAGSIPYVIANSCTRADMEMLAARTAAVASFVGPFKMYGTELVRACVKCGTQYSDSTGESDWVRSMISYYNTAALKNRVRIVSQCGWDSIPFTTVTYLCWAHFQQIGESLSDVVAAIRMKGAGPSGGTMHTVMNVFTGQIDVAVKKLGFNPISTNAAGTGKSTSKVKGYSPACSWNTDLERALGYSVMLACNKEAVRRDGAIHGYENVKYTEALIMPNMFSSLVVMLGMIMFGIMASFPPTRWFLQAYVIPKPGGGPTDEQLANGYWHVNTVGTSKEGSKVFVQLSAEAEGGYVDTGRMVTETAIHLKNTKDSDASAPFGIFMPGALGQGLVDHLCKTGTTAVVSTTFEKYIRE